MQDYIDLSEEKPPKQGKLFIVSTPIGNKDDISFRAVKVLRDSDIVVCEEPKIGTRLLHNYNINQKIDLLNEQNEAAKTQEYVTMMFQGNQIALISDCGTPVFADPGAELVRAALRNNIPIEVVPGASSLMTALVRCGFSITEFLFGGFLSREKEVRISELKKLSQEPRTVAILETPYRLLPVIEAAANIMPDRQAYLGCNLTMGYETNHYGTFSELYHKFKELKFKGEFVIIFEGAVEDKRQLNYKGPEPRRNEGYERKSAPRRYGDEKPDFRKRDDKPDFRKRDDKPDFRKRDDKPDFRKRDDRPDFRKRDDKPDFRKRDDRPDFRQRDDRPDFGKRDDRKYSSTKRSNDKPGFRKSDDGRPGDKFKGKGKSRPGFNDKDKQSRGRQSRPDKPRGNRSTDASK
jgi:16S rRNA (cytidine1402-2'-O)-methyltransferase